jgi:hypothetical protein
MKIKYFQEILVALSLSNLLFIANWRSLIYKPVLGFHINKYPSNLDYTSLMLLIILLSCTLIGAIWCWRYLSNGRTPKVAKIAFLLVVLFALNVVRKQFYAYQKALIGEIGLIHIVGILFLGGLILGVALVKRPKSLETSFEKLFSFSRLVVLILSPFVLITFSQGMWQVLSSSNEATDSDSFSSLAAGDLQRSLARRTKSDQIKSRVVWIIFDELDYRIAFESLPDDIKLAEFDRLKDISLVATKAVPPAPRTFESIPSLLIGRKVKKSKPSDSKDIPEADLEFFGSHVISKCSETPSIFTKAAELGARTAAIGWDHTYCWNAQTDYLSVFKLKSSDRSTRTKSFSDAIYRNLFRFALSLPLGFRFLHSFEQSINSKSYETRHRVIMDQTIQMVSDPNIDLVFIHLPLPHFPYLFNRKTDEFSGGKGYLDNLVLADNVLGDIRTAMEKANIWKESTLIISSDHSWRLVSGDAAFRAELTKEDREISGGIEDKRVPFLLKLANQKQRIDYQSPLNTVATYDLILALITGKVSEPKELNSWMVSNSDK